MTSSFLMDKFSISVNRPRASVKRGKKPGRTSPSKRNFSFVAIVCKLVVRTILHRYRIFCHLINRVFRALVRAHNYVTEIPSSNHVSYALFAHVATVNSTFI